MSTPASISSGQSQFRIEKAKTEATLTLSNGMSVHGCFFLAGNSAAHAGPERIKDLLNGEQAFFPFEVSGPDGARTILLNREHVVIAKLHRPDEAQDEPGYKFATHRRVAMRLSDGAQLKGTVIVYSPQGHDRLSDFVRRPERFTYLESERVTYLVNVRHVIELLEESS